MVYLNQNFVEILKLLEFDLRLISLTLFGINVKKEF
jgi:hypothetical protein